MNTSVCVKVIDLAQKRGLEELDTLEKKKALADRIEELLRGTNSLFVTMMNEEIENLAQLFYKKNKGKTATASRGSISPKTSMCSGSSKGL